MRLIRLLTATAILMALAVPAYAATDLGDGACQQEDGQVGIWNNTTNTDEGCITPTEYAERWSVENLIAVGVISDVVDNGDGTVSATSSTGVGIVLESAPQDRPAEATTGTDTPRTVGEVLFPRAAFGVHPI